MDEPAMSPPRAKVLRLRQPKITAPTKRKRDISLESFSGPLDSAPTRRPSAFNPQYLSRLSPVAKLWRGPKHFWGSAALPGEPARGPQAEAPASHSASRLSMSCMKDCLRHA